MKRLTASAAATLAAAASLFAVSPVSLPTAARAEPPSVSYMFPAGAQRGTTVAVRVGGHYLHDRAPFELIGAGVSGPAEIVRGETIWFEGPLLKLPDSQRQEDYPKDYLAEIRVAPDAPLGTRWWRTWTAQGVTPARRFIVGDLPEIVETELDGEPIPVTVQLPVTVNGRVFPREDVDVWSFAATAGRAVTFAVEAIAFGSPLEARLEIRSPDGRVIMEATGKGGADPILTFTPAVGGQHEVRINDVRGGGLQHYVYRLTITDGPWVRSVYPLGGRRGSNLTVQARGANLGPSDADSASLSGEIPAMAPDRFEHRWTTPNGGTNAVLLAADDWPEHLEVEPNDDAPSNAAPSAPANGQVVAPAASSSTTRAVGSSEAIVVPAVLNGRIGRAGDVDAWSIQLTKDAEVLLDVQASQLGSPLDATLVVRGADGKELAKGEDGPGGALDPQLRFKAPADGVYYLLVRESFASRGGPEFAYRLRVVRPVPSVRLELAADVLSVDRGAQQKLVVNVVREGGFAEPITLAADGVPPGVTAAEVTVAANQNKGELVFKADSSAAIGTSLLRIVGRTQRDGQPAVLPAGVPTRGAEIALDQVRLAVTLPTPFKFQGTYEMTFVPCGAVLRKRFTIERSGYDGPLEVQLADRQARHLQGVTGPVITVPAGASEFVYPITLPPWMELGRTSRTVLMATAQVDDGQGRKHKVSFSSGDQNNQMVNLVSPSPLRIVLDRASLSARAGTEESIQVQLRRDASVQGRVRVELVAPRHLRDVTAEAIELPEPTAAGSSDTARFTLKFGARPGPFTMPVTIRATTTRDGDPLVAEAPLELVSP